jgi:chromosome segregation ATPase
MYKKKNKKLEESIATAQSVQEQCGNHIVELNEQINALQTQNAYLASRIDGQEEEKGALKAEIKKAVDRFADFGKTNNELRGEIEKLDGMLIEIRENVVNLR